MTSGVKIGGYFFPGFKGVIKDHPDRFFVLFAHPYDTPPSAKAVLVATDKAGNSREMPLVYELKDFRYRKSTLALSDNFLQTKVAPLLADAAARQGSPKDLFVAVNKKLRKENEDKITAITRKGSPSILWKGAFVQLSNSKVEANFADHRTYVYTTASRSTPPTTRCDLSVTKRYPVEAANSGAVVFAGTWHLWQYRHPRPRHRSFHAYGHLSQIDVKVGDSVQQRQVLGRTGRQPRRRRSPALRRLLNGVAILPVEWWDSKWIEDNITPKLAGMAGEAIHEAQQPTRGSRKSKRRR